MSSAPASPSSGRPSCVPRIPRCSPELGDAGALDFAAELLRHQLHAVADAERRHAELEDARVDARRPVGVHGRRPAAEDDRVRVARADRLGRDRVPHELGIDAALAHAARDQLRVLAAEVEHEHRALLRELLGRAQCDDLTHAGSSVRPS